MNETDWLLNSLNGTLPPNFADIKQSGFDFKLGKNDSYWNLQQVKDHPAFKDETGKASKKKFDDFYSSNLKTFNEYKKDDFDQFQFEQKRVLDTDQNKRLGFQNFVTKPIDLKVDKLVHNPFKLTKGFTGINEQSSPIQSIQELAQTDSYFDTETGKFIKLNDKIGGWWDAVSLPTLVMAKDENNQYKINPETGTFFYETLAGRDPSGKELLTMDNMLSEEGSFANKLDWMDSDDLNKSIGGTVLKEATKWAPYLIPYVGQAYGATMLGKSMVDIGLEYYKTFDQSVTGKGKDDSRYKGVNEVMGFLNRFTASSVSENAKENPFGAENLISMISNIGLDIKNQKLVAQTGSALAGKNGARAGSMIYNVGTANKAVMDIADTNNLSPQDRGLLSLATTAAFGVLYSNLKINPLSAFTNYVEKGAIQNVESGLIKKSIMESADVLAKEIAKTKGLPPEEKAKAFLDITKKIAGNYKGKLEGFVKELKESGATSIPAAAVAESVEETSETVLQESLLQFYNSISDPKNLFGYKATNTKNKDGSSFKFKDLWGENFKDDLLMSAFGGAIAGGGMYAINSRKSPKTTPELIALIQQGKTEEALQMVDELEKKGAFAPQDLSMESVELDGEVYWKPKNKDSISQNKFVADTMRREIIKNDNFVKTLGVDKDGLDTASDTVKQTFNNLIDSDFHTSLRSDNIGLTNQIVAQAKAVRDLETLAKTTTDEATRDQTEIRLKEARAEYTNLQQKLNNNIINEGRFENLDDYVKQSLFSTYPSVGSKFGIKNKKDFTDTEGKFDEEGYKKYVQEQRTEDIKRSISEYDLFSNEENIKKIKSITPEDFDNYFKNRILENDIDKFLKSDATDFEITDEIIPEEDLINKLSDPYFDRVNSALLESNNELVKIYNNLLDYLLENKVIESGFTPKDTKEIIDILDKVSKNVKDSISDEKIQVLEDNGFDELAENYRDILAIDSAVSNFDNSNKELNKIKKTKEYRLLEKLKSKEKVSKVSNKIDDLFGNLKFELAQQKELSKNSTTYSTKQIQDNLDMLDAAIDKYSGYISSMITVNPSMNNFRQSEKAKQYITNEKKLNQVDYAIESNTHDLLQDKLGRYKSEVTYFKKLVEDNQKNKLKYIIQDQVIQAKRIVDELKKLVPDLEFNSSKIDTLFSDGEAGKLVDYKTDSVELKIVYEELEKNFELFKSKYRSDEKFQSQIKSKLADAKGMSYVQGKNEFNAEERVNLINTIIRGNYSDFLARLRNTIDSNNNYAPFYYQESSLYQIFSKLQSPEQDNILLNSEEKQAKAKLDKTFVADNILLIDNTAGAGKTSIILRLATQLDISKKFALFAPKEKQLDLIRKSIIGLDTEQLEVKSTFEALEESLFGKNRPDATRRLKYVRNSNGNLVPDIEYLENSVIINYAEGEPQTINFDENTLKAFEGKDALILDEGTHLNPIAYYFLKKLNIPIFVMLDTSQLGHTHKGVITGVKGFENQEIEGEWTIDSAMVERTPKQTYSVRNQYQGVPEATRAMFGLLNAEELNVNGSTNSTFAKLKEKDTYQIPYQYYLQDDFIGFYVGENKQDEVLAKIPKNVDKNEIVFIVRNDKEQEETEKKYKDRGTVLMYDQVQGQEFDYVFILSTPFSDENKSVFSTQAYLKNLYTLVSRSKKGAYYNKENGYEVAFRELESLKSASKSIPLSEENIKDYKDFKIKSLENYTQTVEGQVNKAQTQQDDDEIIKAVEKEDSLNILNKLGELLKTINSKNLNNEKEFYVRLFTWYSNKAFTDKLKSLNSKMGNNELTEQITVAKHALVYGDSLFRKKEYLNKFIKKFQDSGFDTSILEAFKNKLTGDIQYTLKAIPWSPEDVTSKDADPNYGAKNRDGNQKNMFQMMIVAKVGDLELDLVSLPFIDDYRVKKDEGGASSGYYLETERENEYKTLRSLQDKLQKEDIILDSKRLQALLSIEKRGKGRIYKNKDNKEFSLEEYKSQNPSITMSKPFLITQSNGDLRGKLGVFYSYDFSENLDTISDEADLSRVYDDWISNKDNKRASVGLFFLNEQAVGLNEVLNNFNEIRGKVTNGEDADSNQYFATRLNSLFSNNGLKQFFTLVHKLYNHKSTKGATSPDFIKTAELKNYINTDNGYKKIFPSAESNPFILNEEEFKKFLDDFKEKPPSHPVGTLYKESRTYGLLSKLDDLRIDKSEKRYNFENSYKDLDFNFKIQKGFVKEYLTKTKLDAKKDEQTAKNKVAIIEGDFKTRFRISPIEVAIDISYFRELLDPEEKVENAPKNPEPKPSTSEETSYEDENLTEDVFEDEEEEQKEVVFAEKESKKDGIVRFETNLDVVPKERVSAVVSIVDLNEELITQDKSTNLDEKLNDLLNVQKYRFGDINQLFSYATERLYYDIVLPSSYLDLEKGVFIRESKINDNILSAKMRLIKDIIQRSKKKELDITEVKYKDVEYNLTDFINDESIPLGNRINTIVKQDVLRGYLNSDKPKDLYHEYQRIKELNDSQHSINRGSENDVIKQYVDYVILKDFDLFVKGDENIKSRIANAGGIYVRKKQKGFDKSYKESSEIDIKEAGTELFTTTIETIPLIEKIGDKYKETGKLQYSKIMNLFIDMKSDPRWKRINIHDELKSIILDRMLNRNNIDKTINIPLHERNMYRSLYYFLYSPSDIVFTDRFNQTKTYKSIDHVLKTTTFGEAKLFHTAIENIINTMNRNYQMGIVKQGEEFNIIDPITDTSDKYKAMIIAQSLNFINDKNKDTAKGIVENGKLQKMPVVKYKDVDDNFALAYDITSPFRFLDRSGTLTPYGISWMKLNAAQYFTTENPNDKDMYMRMLKSRVATISNMIHIAKLSKDFEDKGELKEKVINLLEDTDVNKFFKEMEKEEFNVENLGKSFIFQAISEEFSKAITMTLDSDEKSVQQSLDGKAAAKFTPMNNTLEIFNRVLRDKEEGSDILFKNDLIDLLNNC